MLFILELIARFESPSGTRRLRRRRWHLPAADRFSSATVHSNKKASSFELAFLLELIARFELAQRISLARDSLVCFFRSLALAQLGRQFEYVQQQKKQLPHWGDCFFGADSQIRTGDLILTKDALYLLSYISKIHAP